MKSLSCTALADAIEVAARETPPAPAVTAMASGAPVDRLRAYAAHDSDALAVLDRLCQERVLTTDLKSTILNTLSMLEAEFRTASPIRRGPLGKALLTAIDRARIYFPEPPPQKTRNEVLEELLALDADAIARIEEHLPDPIDPKEIQ